MSQGTAAVLFGIAFALAALPAYGNGGDLTAISRVEQSLASTPHGGDSGTATYRLQGTGANEGERAAAHSRALTHRHAKHSSCRVKVPHVGTGVGVVSGVVFDHAGAPAANVAVRVAGREKVVTSFTDTAGRYTLGLDAGDYSISVGPGLLEPEPVQSGTGSTQVQVAPGAPARIDFTMRAGTYLPLPRE